MWIAKYYKFIEALCKSFKLDEDMKQDLYYELLLKGDISQLDNPRGYLFNCVKFASWKKNKIDNENKNRFEKFAD